MKKLLVALILGFIGTGISHADTTTTNLSLTLPTTTTADVWGTTLNNDFLIIDSSAAGKYTSQTLTGNNTFSGVTTVTNLHTSTVTFSDASTQITAFSSATINITSATITNLNTTTFKVGGSTMSIVRQIVMCSTPSQTSTTSSSYQDTQSSCTITPTSSSSRILVRTDGSLQSNTDNTIALTCISRGSGCIAGASSWLGETTNNTGHITSTVSMIYLDSPATTSLTQYKVQVRNTNNSGTVVYGDSNGSSSIMILEEINP